MSSAAPPPPSFKSKTFQASVRIEVAVAERADRLATRMSDRADLRAFTVSRAAMLRLAMLRGLDALEADIDLEPLPVEQPKGNRTSSKSRRKASGA